MYQMACKPRVFPDEKEQEEINQKVIDHAMKTLKDREDLKKFKFDTTENQVVTATYFEDLKEGLLCSVCADVYMNPLNVRSCLHKFCSTCIEDYNRIYKKECPACRA